MAKGYVLMRNRDRRFYRPRHLVKPLSLRARAAERLREIARTELAVSIAAIAAGVLFAAVLIWSWPTP